MQRKCAGVANLVFATGKGKTRPIPAADHCIVLTSFVDHAWSHLAKQTFGRSRTHFRRGASQVLAAIHDIAAGRPLACTHV